MRKRRRQRENSAGTLPLPAARRRGCRFAAERELLERHGHTVLVYERSNEEAAHGAAKALLPLHAVWNRRAAREVKD